MIRKIEILFFCIITLKIILTGILTTISSYCEFYKFEKPGFYSILKNENFIDNFLSSYTGFDTGYGFFAPNVSSNFVIISEDGEHSYLSSELMKSNEGKMRFLSLNDVFFKNIEKDQDKIKSNKIILNKINQRFEDTYKKNFTTSVYLYEYPRLNSNSVNGPKLIKICENK